jgi:hypothetical protein
VTVPVTQAARSTSRAISEVAAPSSSIAVAMALTRPRIAAATSAIWPIAAAMRAASIVALSASRLDCEAIELIRPTTSPMRCAEARTMLASPREPRIATSAAAAAAKLRSAAQPGANIAACRTLPSAGASARAAVAAGLAIRKRPTGSQPRCSDIGGKVPEGGRRELGRRRPKTSARRFSDRECKV